MDVALAGGKVNAAVIGEGRSIVLLHSLLADRASFDGIKIQLSKRFRVIVPELPGFGLSAAIERNAAAPSSENFAPQPARTSRLAISG